MTYHDKGQPFLAFTMGDVAGIGPEIIARGWADLCKLCKPVVVGDAAVMQRALDLIGSKIRLQPSIITSANDRRLVNVS